MFCANCGREMAEGARFCESCGTPAAAGQAASAGASVPAPTATTATDVTGRRILAALIDILLMSFLFLAMAAVLGDVGKENTGNSKYSWGATLEAGPFILYLGLVYAYYAILEALTGATLGKMVIGLKVVKLDGSAFGLGASLLRNLIRFVDFLPVFYLLGLISVAMSKQKQRLGDMAAGTLVVRAR